MDCLEDPMYPSLRQFMAFIKVARLGSFARAAEALGTSQPALSQSIAQMEAMLGLRLFQRTTRTVRLTAEGQFLLPRAERIAAEVEETVSALRDHAHLRRSRISIGTLPSFATGIMPAVLQLYREQHSPSQLVVTDGTSDALYAGIESGALDVAIGSRLPGHPDVAFRPILRERFALVLRHEHPLAAQARVAWREALSQDFIAFPPGSGGRMAMQDALERAGLTLDPVMTFAQSTTVLGMVEAGMGVTAIPALGCPARDHKSLCSRDLVEPVVDRELGILRAAHAAPGTAMLALQELIIGCVARCKEAGIVPVRSTQGG
jgi:DNA-binding transcriptional LysR family regulator